MSGKNMFYSAVLCCLMLFIKGTNATCAQQDTQECDQFLVTAACNILKEIGEQTPQYCPPIFRSCQDHHLHNPSAPSGSYQIELSNGTMVNVYCDMEGTNCNGQGGWTRVAFVNMSQPGASCPTGLTQIEQSGLTLCSVNDTNLVQSAFFTTLGLNYSTVCGRLRGYQLGQAGAFVPYVENRSISIDDNYVIGVSITHGSSPRNHLWTYAIGFEDDDPFFPGCPCNNGSTESTPPFVGDSYYCESGTHDAMGAVQLYSDDPLWDGMQCNNLEGPCCVNSSQPWFTASLAETTNDDLEARLMLTTANEGVPLDLIEFYIR